MNKEGSGVGSFCEPSIPADSVDLHRMLEQTAARLTLRVRLLLGLSVGLSAATASFHDASAQSARERIFSLTFASLLGTPWESPHSARMSGL